MVRGGANWFENSWNVCQQCSLWVAIYEDLETTKPSANQHDDNEGETAIERPIYCLLGCMATFNASHKRKQSSSLSPAFQEENLSPAAFFRIFASVSSNSCRTERVSVDAQEAIGEKETTFWFLGIFLLGLADWRVSACAEPSATTTCKPKKKTNNAQTKQLPTTTTRTRRHAGRRRKKRHAYRKQLPRVERLKKRSHATSRESNPRINDQHQLRGRSTNPTRQNKVNK